MRHVEDLSEAHIRAHCPHCDASSSAFQYPLEEIEYFRIVYDVSSIVKGHILIIPKSSRPT